ncbi:MAG: hypothetical protein HYZ75_14245 [Elusimicrobia bacterium]|nr:hypothetical protein [Elusimicrobiota bacterium]
MQTALKPSPLAPQTTRSWSLTRFLGLSVVLGAVGLGMEYRYAGTLLLTPSYRWTTSEVPGMRLAGPDGYSLDFHGTQLDWRILSRDSDVSGPDFVLLGYPSLKLTVSRQAEPGPEFDESVGAFPLGDGFVVLSFERYQSPDGRMAEEVVILNDIRKVAASFLAEER